LSNQRQIVFFGFILVCSLVLDQGETPRSPRRTHRSGGFGESMASFGQRDPAQVLTGCNPAITTYTLANFLTARIAARLMVAGDPA
jgi:hypothetical protein